MQKLRFAVIGCGFWSQFQIAAWHEFSDSVKLVAVCDRDLAKAQERAAAFGGVSVYADAKQMLANERLDFVDVITDVDTHSHFVHLAADHGLDVICQKPMAPTLQEAAKMVAYAEEKGVQFLVHENFRWQTPLRRFKELLAQGTIGDPFKGRLSFCSHFPVFRMQPFLAELEQFILTDIGAHLLDMARFLFGEARSLRCLTQRVNPDIRGEDVANVFMEMESGLHCYVEMSYASQLEREAFPRTLIEVEGTQGSLGLELDDVVRITNQVGTLREKVIPTHYDWADPDYALIHSSIVACNEDLLQALRGSRQAETHGADNLRTVQLLFDAYTSADTNTLITY
ncbi:MAG: Gfo/Idh/MocA family oxidoreductase [Bacteroidota bacterium]